MTRLLPAMENYKRTPSGGPLWHWQCHGLEQVALKPCYVDPNMNSERYPIIMTGDNSLLLTVGECMKSSHRGMVSLICEFEARVWGDAYWWS